MKAILLFSGGMDSTVLLAQLLEGFRREDILLLTARYGNLHAEAEKRATGRIIKHYGVEIRRIALPFVEKYGKGSILIHKAGEMAGAATIVPLRNVILTSIAASMMANYGEGDVYIGATQSDAVFYPDCRYPFMVKMDEAIYAGSDHAVRLRSPYTQMRKSDVVKLGENLEVPWLLTYSCYLGNLNHHCGECGACLERKKAFFEADVSDPTTYDE
jgi:7-cyano-7-deazaguanine synthase